LISVLKPNFIASYLFFEVPIINYIASQLNIMSSKSTIKVSNNNNNNNTYDDKSEDLFMKTLSNSKKPLFFITRWYERSIKAI